MRYFLFILLFISCTLNPLISQHVTCTTIQLLNKEFVVADNWSPLPVDRQGEDVNSLRYGGVSFPPYSIGSDLQETRQTIALGELDINFEMNNPTDDTWEITEVQLVTKRKHSIDKIEYQKGVWDLGSLRSLNYIPKLNLTEVVSDEPKNLFISPSADLADNRFWVEVTLSGEGKMVYAFEVHFILTNLINNEQLSIKAEKVYLIASK